MARALLLTVSLVAACYSPPEPPCGFFCGPAQACPADYHCAADGVCHLNSAPASLQCGADAAVDAPRFPGDDVLFADAADVDPPYVAQTFPTSGATGVALDMSIEVQFSEPVQNVDGSTFTVTIASAPYPGTVTSSSLNVYYFTPTANWPPASTIDVQLSAAIHDFAGNTLAPTSFSFATN